RSAADGDAGYAIAGCWRLRDAMFVEGDHLVAIAQGPERRDQLVANLLGIRVELDRAPVEIHGAAQLVASSTRLSRLIPAISLRSRLVDLAARRAQHVPVRAEALDRLAVGIARVPVLGEEVQRVALVGHLRDPVRPGDRAEVGRVREA